MDETLTIEALQQRIAELEAELTRLRPLEAAANEAYAYYKGRRAGFPPSYPRDILIAAFEPDKPRSKQSRPNSPPTGSRRK